MPGAGAGEGRTDWPGAKAKAGLQWDHSSVALRTVGCYLGCCNIHEGEIRYLNLFSNKCVSVGEHSSC